LQPLLEQLLVEGRQLGPAGEVGPVEADEVQRIRERRRECLPAARVPAVEELREERLDFLLVVVHGVLLGRSLVTTGNAKCFDASWPAGSGSDVGSSRLSCVAASACSEPGGRCEE